MIRAHTVHTPSAYREHAARTATAAADAAAAATVAAAAAAAAAADAEADAAAALEAALRRRVLLWRSSTSVSTLCML